MALLTSKILQNGVSTRLFREPNFRVALAIIATYPFMRLYKCIA